MIDLDALPYVPAFHQGPRPAGMIPNLIVLHSGETNEGPTAAEGMAAYFASGATIGSAHISIDGDSIVRCAPDVNRTNGAGGVNDFSLHIEQAGRAGQNAEEWADPYSSAVVRQAAEVTQAWLARYPHIRPVFLDAAALARGERDGITTHAEISQVFDGNDGHWDPGPAYPIDAFLRFVIDGDAAQPRPQETDAMYWYIADLSDPKDPLAVYKIQGNVIVKVFKGPSSNPYGIPDAAIADAGDRRIDSCNGAEAELLRRAHANATRA